MNSAMNVCQRQFRTRLDVEEWVARQVVRVVRKLAYVSDVRDVDRATQSVEILDSSRADFAPEVGDEPLRSVARIWRQDGVYRVGVPA